MAPWNTVHCFSLFSAMVSLGPAVADHGPRTRNPVQRNQALPDAVTAAAAPTVDFVQIGLTYASFGAGGGFGLPIIGKLLGHTQASTTHRYRAP
jgi:hypothetical protein